MINLNKLLKARAKMDYYGMTDKGLDATLQAIGRYFETDEESPEIVADSDLMEDLVKTYRQDPDRIEVFLDGADEQEQDQLWDNLLKTCSLMGCKIVGRSRNYYFIKLRKRDRKKFTNSLEKLVICGQQSNIRYRFQHKKQVVEQSEVMV